MFKLKKTTTEPSLNDLIDAIISEMNLYGPEAEEYPPLLDRLERLMKMKAETRLPRLTPDGALAAVGNLAGIAVIVLVERSGVWTSKATGLLARPK